MVSTCCCCPVSKAAPDSWPPRFHCCAPGEIPQLAALEQGTDTINQMCLPASRWPHSQATAAGLSTADAAATAAGKWRAARQQSRAAETGYCFGSVDLCSTTGSGEERLPIEGFLNLLSCNFGVHRQQATSTPACCAATKRVVPTWSLISSEEHNQA